MEEFIIDALNIIAPELINGLQAVQEVKKTQSLLASGKATKGDLVDILETLRLMCTRYVSKKTLRTTMEDLILCSARNAKTIEPCIAKSGWWEKKLTYISRKKESIESFLEKLKKGSLTIEDVLLLSNVLAKEIGKNKTGFKYFFRPLQCCLLEYIEMPAQIGDRDLALTLNRLGDEMLRNLRRNFQYFERFAEENSVPCNE